MISEIVSWYLYDFLMILCYLFYIFVQSKLYIKHSIYSIYSISVYLFDLYQLFFFFSSFSFLQLKSLKRVYKTINLSNNAFSKHYVFENNLIFNIIRLTFLASESLELIQKTLYLKVISYLQLLIPTKRYLWNFFPILFTGSIWNPSFSWKVLTSANF